MVVPLLNLGALVSISSAVVVPISTIGTNLLTMPTDAARYAEAAGRLLVKVRAENQHLTMWELGDQGDLAANTLLLQLIAADHPSDAVLTEESADVGDRRRAERVWIIDPLDGTREFREGREDWAVHVALWQRGVGLTDCVVALPDWDKVLPNGVRGPQRSNRIVASRTRAPVPAVVAARELGMELVPMGSAGAKAAAVVLGKADAYVHSGGLNEWDAAAPVGMAVAAGLHASHLDGRPIVFNAPDPWIPDLLICVPELAQPIIDITAHLLW
jgi:3'(2'), 5'-bisphosphate nucleotidase